MIDGKYTQSIAVLQEITLTAPLLLAQVEAVADVAVTFEVEPRTSTTFRQY